MAISGEYGFKIAIVVTVWRGFQNVALMSVLLDLRVATCFLDSHYSLCWRDLVGGCQEARWSSLGI